MLRSLFNPIATLLTVASVRSLKAPSAAQVTFPRVILNPLPRVYVYDHCPFCVRVRLALGIKNIKHEIRFLANDDVSTPTALVGKKVAPIFEMPGEKAMPESLDIISKIDSDPQFGPIGAIRPFSGRSDLKDWQAKVSDLNRVIIRPRYMMVPLPEFMQRDGRDAFVRNHPLPPFEKDEWKKLSSAEQWGKYEEAYTQSLGTIEELNKALEDLEGLLHSPECATAGGVSLDDIDLFSRLRSITLVRGVKWPSKLAAYMKHYSEVADIPLYDTMSV